MLNTHGLSDEQKEILKLKKCISDFKEYDKQRKEYIKSLLAEISELQELVGEDVKTKIKGYKQEISHLANRLALCNRPEILKMGNEVVRKHINNARLTEENSRLRKENLSLKKSISDLVAKLNRPL